MFDSLLGPKFSNKCKHSVKCIKCRMVTIQKKKHAMERCLKKDVADLISTGHDANAFGRIDALLFEINQTSCYDMIEQYCCCILEHLQTMQKERECPKETVEAVATLIFAAARFSDLPELADLRRGFTERFRTTMESCTNREFVEKLQKKSFPQAEKLQLMKDIAEEFNIDWDVKSFEYKMSNPSAPAIDHSKIHFPSSNKNYIESHITDERSEVTYRRNEGVNGIKTVLEKTDCIREVTNRRNEVVNGRKTVLIQIEGSEHHSISAVQKHQIQTEEHKDIPHDCGEKIKKVAADESKNIEPRQKRPPYVKEIEHNGRQRQTNGAVNPESKITSNLKPPYVKPKAESLFETGFVKPSSYEINSGNDNGVDHYNAAFSVRRKQLEQGTAAYSGSPGEDSKLLLKFSTKQAGVVMNTLNDQQGYSWKSKQIEETIHGRSINAAYDGEYVKEEETVEKLSQHYSKKGARNEPGKARTGTRETQRQAIFDSSRVAEKIIKDEQYSKISAHTPTRTVSLPPTETPAGRHVRSVSMQPDPLDPNGERSHPRPPDYDELAARIAALRKP